MGLDVIESLQFDSGLTNGRELVQKNRVHFVRCASCDVGEFAFGTVVRLPILVFCWFQVLFCSLIS